MDKNKTAGMARAITSRDAGLLDTATALTTMYHSTRQPDILRAASPQGRQRLHIARTTMSLNN